MPSLSASSYACNKPRVDLYFQHINPWANLLIRADVSLYHAAPSPATPHSTASSGIIPRRPPSVAGSHLTVGSTSHGRPSILIYAIVAITLRFSDSSYFSPSGPRSKASYHTQAKNRVVLKAMDRMSADGLKALAILALDWMESGNGPSGWGGVLSLLTGGVGHSGLGEEEDIVNDAVEERAKTSSTGSGPREREFVATSKTTLFPQTEDWKEIEERRRLFWCKLSVLLVSSEGCFHLYVQSHEIYPDATFHFDLVLANLLHDNAHMVYTTVTYFLDRYASVSTGWDFAFRESEVRRRLPGPDDAWQHGLVRPTLLFIRAQTTRSI